MNNFPAINAGDNQIVLKSTPEKTNCGTTLNITFLKSKDRMGFVICIES